MRRKTAANDRFGEASNPTIRVDDLGAYTSYPPKRIGSGSSAPSVQMHDPYTSLDDPSTGYLTPESSSPSSPTHERLPEFPEANTVPLSVSRPYPWGTVEGRLPPCGPQLSSSPLLGVPRLRPLAHPEQFWHQTPRLLSRPIYPPSPVSSESSAEQSPRSWPLPVFDSRNLTPDIYSVLSSSFRPSSPNFNLMPSSPTWRSHYPPPLTPIVAPDDAPPVEPISVLPSLSIPSGGRTSGAGYCRNLPPLHILNRPQPYRRDPTDDRTLRILELRSFGNL